MFSGSTQPAGEHNHSHGINGSVSVSVDTVAGHSHTVGGALRSRNAGTISVSRHDSSELDGTYYLQIRAAQGGSAALSQRYIHAITMRR